MDVPGIAALVGGWLSDGLLRRGYSLSTARKVPLVAGMLGNAAIGVAAVSPTLAFAMAALCLSNFSSTFASSAVWSLPADVAPAEHYVGSIGGIRNTASNVAGIVSPILIGVLLGINKSFTVPLLLTGAVGIAGAVIYGLWLPKLGGSRWTEGAPMADTSADVPADLGRSLTSTRRGGPGIPARRS